MIRLVDIEDDKININLQGLEDKEKLAQSKVEYYKERYSQLTYELTDILKNNKEARNPISEEEAMQILQSSIKLRKGMTST